MVNMCLVVVVVFYLKLYRKIAFTWEHEHEHEYEYRLESQKIDYKNNNWNKTKYNTYQFCGWKRRCCVFGICVIQFQPTIIERKMK